MTGPLIRNPQSATLTLFFGFVGSADRASRLDQGLLRPREGLDRVPGFEAHLRRLPMLGLDPVARPHRRPAQQRQG